LISLLLVLLGSGAYLLLSRRHGRLVSRQTVPTGQPALLYFRSDYCAACGAQSRFVAELEQRLAGRLLVERIDAEVEMEKAARFGVFTLPTTMVLDHAGAVRHVNYGLADAAKLARQVESIE
jgi:thioredoxin-like negative regulator of GroEL